MICKPSLTTNYAIYFNVATCFDKCWSPSERKYQSHKYIVAYTLALDCIKKNLMFHFHKWTNSCCLVRFHFIILKMWISTCKILNTNPRCNYYKTTSEISICIDSIVTLNSLLLITSNTVVFNKFMSYILMVWRWPN